MKDNTREPKNYVNRRERLGGMICVLLLFLLGSGLGSWALVGAGNPRQVFARKDRVSTLMRRQHDFRREQEQAVAACKRLEERIAAYDPGINAVYEKNDIQFMINELRKQYEQNRLDRRYMAYMHLGDYYQMWFNDRQHLWSLRTNISYLKQNLEECELGLGRKRN